MMTTYEQILGEESEEYYTTTLVVDAGGIINGVYYFVCARDYSEGHVCWFAKITEGYGDSISCSGVRSNFNDAMEAGFWRVVEMLDNP